MFDVYCIIEQARGNMHQHGIMKDIKYEYNGRKMSVETLDIPLATWGKPTGMPVPFQKPDIINVCLSIRVLWDIGGLFLHVHEQPLGYQLRHVVSLR